MQGDVEGLSYKKAQCPPEKARKRLHDSGGLYLEVRDSGSKLWRWKYRHQGAEKVVQGYMREDHEKLVALWKKVDPEVKTPGGLWNLARHIRFGELHDYDDIAFNDIPDTQLAAAKLAAGSSSDLQSGFEDLLHPAVETSSLKQYKDGYLREAVLNAVIAVYDMIRSRTGLALDGTALAGQAFDLENGLLVFSELQTESGQNDQKGFLQIFQGVYTGIRNVKAHSLN